VALAEFEQTGRIAWTSDLADIPRNTACAMSMAMSASSSPQPWWRSRGLRRVDGHPDPRPGRGPGDLGTDALWTGSPQWQIEGLRRMEIPEDMQKSFGFAPLGAARGPVKTAIFGDNNARLYGIDQRKASLEVVRTISPPLGVTMRRPPRSQQFALWLCQYRAGSRGLRLDCVNPQRRRDCTSRSGSPRLRPGRRNSAPGRSCKSRNCLCPSADSGRRLASWSFCAPPRHRPGQETGAGAQDASAGQPVLRHRRPIAEFPLRCAPCYARLRVRPVTLIFTGETGSTGTAFTANSFSVRFNGLVTSDFSE